MHDDQIRSLLRNLERDQEPDPAFADALFDRLAVTADDRRRGRTPFLLLAAALLLAALAAGAAIGSGWLRLPLLVDGTQSPEPTSSGVAVASPTASASPSQAAPSGGPSVSPDPAVLTGRTLFVEADGLRVRAEASDDAEVVATLRRGQLMGATGNQASAGGMEWYEVRIGPGSIAGWVAGGPDGVWLRLVEDGQLTFRCDGCADGPMVVSVTPFGDAAIASLGSSAELLEWRWSPDGTRMVVARGGTTLPTRLALLAPDGTEIGELGIGVAAAWSPDGTRLAWLGEPGGGVVVTDQELVPQPFDLGELSPGGPVWSPDGTRLAMTAGAGDETIDPPSAVYVVPIGGGDPEPLTEPAYPSGLAWLPDGSGLSVFFVDLSGATPSQAFVVPIDGGEPAPVLGGTTATTTPAWSPDGTRLVVATPDGVTVAASDGSGAEVLVPVDDGTFIGEVTWSPSGGWITFTTSTGREPTLWIVPADGSEEPRQISSDGADGQQAVWQPILVPLP